MILSSHLRNTIFTIILPKTYILSNLSTRYNSRQAPLSYFCEEIILVNAAITNTSRLIKCFHCSFSMNNFILIFLYQCCNFFPNILLRYISTFFLGSGSIRGTYLSLIYSVIFFVVSYDSFTTSFVQECGVYCTIFLSKSGKLIVQLSSQRVISFSKNTKLVSHKFLDHIHWNFLRGNIHT